MRAFELLQLSPGVGRFTAVVVDGRVGHALLRLVIRAFELVEQRFHVPGHRRVRLTLEACCQADFRNTRQRLGDGAAGLGLEALDQRVEARIGEIKERLSPGKLVDELKTVLGAYLDAKLAGSPA